MQLNNRSDPTRSKTLRDEYSRELRGGFATLSAKIRRGIDESDGFVLRNNQEMPIFRFDSDADKHDAFMRWLRQEEERDILNRISRNNNPYVRSAYSKGVDHADKEMRKVGIEPGETDNIFNMPVHEDSIKSLYSRNFEELRGITNEMDRQISRSLAAGFTAGQNPRAIARDLTNRVDKVGKHRANLLARTEIINAHSDAMLNRYEQMGIHEVGYKAEFITAGDKRVCSTCASREGETYEIPKMRTGTFSFGGKTFATKPPIHPQCRCTLVPVYTN